MDVVNVVFWANGKEHLARLAEMRTLLSEKSVLHRAKWRRVALTWEDGEQMILYRYAGFATTKREIWLDSYELRKVLVRSGGKVIHSDEEKRDALLSKWNLVKVEMIPERRALRVHYQTLSLKYELTGELDLNDAVYRLELKRLEYSYRRDLQCELRAVSETDYKRFHKKYIAISSGRGGWWLRVEPRRMYLVV